MLRNKNNGNSREISPEVNNKKCELSKKTVSNVAFHTLTLMMNCTLCVACQATLLLANKYVKISLLVFKIKTYFIIIFNLFNFNLCVYNIPHILVLQYLYIVN